MELEAGLDRDEDVRQLGVRNHRRGRTMNMMVALGAGDRRGRVGGTRSGGVGHGHHGQEHQAEDGHGRAARKEDLRAQAGGPIVAAASSSR